MGVPATTCCVRRVGQNHTFIGTYGIFSREITVHTVIYGADIRLWPTLFVCFTHRHIHNAHVLTDPAHLTCQASWMVLAAQSFFAPRVFLAASTWVPRNCSCSVKCCRRQSKTCTSESLLRKNVVRYIFQGPSAAGGSQTRAVHNLCCAMM